MRVTISECKKCGSVTKMSCNCESDVDDLDSVIEFIFELGESQFGPWMMIGGDSGIANDYQRKFEACRTVIEMIQDSKRESREPVEIASVRGDVAS